MTQFKITDLSGTVRNGMAMLFDVLVAAAAWLSGHWFRFNLDIPPFFHNAMWATLPVVVLIQLGSFWSFGLYRGIWRYASIHDLKRIVMAVLFAAILVPAVLLLWRYGEGVPRSIYMLNPLMLILGMCAGRISYRAWKEHATYGEFKEQGKPILVFGAGDVAAGLLKEIERSAEWQVVGLLDDDPAKLGRSMKGVKVLGRWSELSRVAVQTKARHAILAIPNPDQKIRRRIFELCEESGVKVLIMPDMDDIVSGRVQNSQIRQIELEDLLGRDPVSLDISGLSNFFSAKSVLITGAGGSIGSEICRQIAKYRPSVMICFEQSEFALYKIVEEFGFRFPSIRIVPVVGDVKDAVRLDEVMAKFQPRIVFHAAAYKHVPLMEENNAWQAVKNNVLGTYQLARAANKYEVEKLIFISTDKAVNPTNVMGATKRLGEMLLQKFQSHSNTKFMMVRFGNVLGSNGSVIPKFKEQIERGGPITVTHQDMTRYFMTIPEASQLVLQAGLMGQGGEIFVLDMGEPVKIMDLARDMIKLSGYTEEQIKIKITGLRSGEKLFEELLADNEKNMRTAHAKLWVAKVESIMDGISYQSLVSWIEDVKTYRDTEVKLKLNSFVPEYVVGKMEAAAPVKIVADNTIRSIDRDDNLPEQLAKQ
ncbi:polysaccharide biosynthesis protein [Ampullimonas aquatilis]|uniref:polysaccharide biosynthesis protein n=1 Tax=Ampullimonas aquatilis TaxID=1341549 RepID=UPI003C76E21B